METYQSLFMFFDFPKTGLWDLIKTMLNFLALCKVYRQYGIVNQMVAK